MTFAQAYIALIVTAVNVVSLAALCMVGKYAWTATGRHQLYGRKDWIAWSVVFAALVALDALNAAALRDVIAWIRAG